jgi:anti-sigma factor RsiW
MNCRDLDTLVHDLADGSLKGRDRERVKRHVDGCPNCAQQLSELRSLNTLLDEMPLEPAPLGLADRVIGRLKEAGRIAEPVTAPGGLFYWTRDRFKVALAGMAVLIVAIAVLPLTIGPLEGIVGKGTVLVTDAYIEVQERASDAGALSRMLDVLERNLRMLKTVALAAFSLLARAGELFMIPALLTILLLTLGVLLFLRVSQKRSGERATYSF